MHLDEPLPRNRSLGPGVTARQALTALAAILTGLLAAAFLTAFVLAPFLGYRLLSVESDSMAPAIERGDLVIIRPTSVADVETGDIVAFLAGGDRVATVHRVVGKNEIELAVTDQETGARTVTTEYRLVTKGDNNPSPDSQEVTADRLTGEVWLVIPAAGYLSGGALRGLLFVVFAGTLVSWIAWEAIHRLRQRIRRGSQPRP